MHQSRLSSFGIESSPIPVHFGALLRLLRDRHGLGQAEVVYHLKGWQQASYSKVERGSRAPLFEQLEPIYGALKRAGVQLTMQDREHFYLLARDLLESRQRRHAHRSDEAWNGLYTRLAAIDGYPITKSVPQLSQPMSRKHMEQTPRREVGHLLGREAWLASIIDMIVEPAATKVVVLQGPPGCGKTSEMHRLANHFSRHILRYFVVICEPPPIQLEQLEPIDVLEQLLEDILEIVGSAYTAMPTSTLQTRIHYVLGTLAKAEHPVVICLDNAEHIFDESGNLEKTWQRFLIQFAQASHRATLVVASQEWPLGAFLVESQLVRTVDVPLLSQREGCQLLQTLGLRNVPNELLGRAVNVTGGMPICLEWVVRLVREPFLRDEWTVFEEKGDDSAVLEQLLEDPALYGGSVEQRLQPLLDRVLRRLSAEAITALQDLALAPVPLGAPALKKLYQSPKVLRELREASLLVSYPQRVQLLPMVSASVRKNLTEEQAGTMEERLVQAITSWLNEGISNTHEQGVVFTELVCLLLRRRQFLPAAELVLYHGWLSSHVGRMLRLACLMQQVSDGARRDSFSRETGVEEECGKRLLHFYLASYLGEKIDRHARAEAYEQILAHVYAGRVIIEPLMQVHLVEHIMRDRMGSGKFEEAQHLFDTCFSQLESLFAHNPELEATLLSKKAVLFDQWSNGARSEGRLEEAQMLRSQTIATYDSCLALLEKALLGVQEGTLFQSTLRKKKATFLNNLAYQLNIAGRYNRAIEVIDACIELKERGYAERDSLAASYGEKSQIQAALGRFQEALRFDELARDEIRRCAEAGDTSSQEERWIYQVNQAYVYFLLGRIGTAEQLLREAEPKIQERRAFYKMRAKALLSEIDTWRTTSRHTHYQLDWRWIERYRKLSAYDAYWWWAHAGPFNEEEQRQWNQLFSPQMDGITKGQLRGLLLQARDRELDAALLEGREPRLCYPAIEIEKVRQRIADFLALEAEISEKEPNAIVRRLYHGAIEDEMCFLKMIEATYEGSNIAFWERTQQLYALPTAEEMQYALEQVRQIVSQGLQHEHTAEVSRRVMKVLRQVSHLSLDGASDRERIERVQKGISRSSAQKSKNVSAQAVQHFFEALLRESGYEGWTVELDANASGPRIESGLRRVFLPTTPMTLEDIREYISHELLGHVTRSVAGENSCLGLLAMGTKGYMPTEEGIADYHERHVATLHGQAFDDSGTWLGTLAIGLASGVITPPHTFSTLFSFFEPFLLLYRLLWRDDEELPVAQQRARQNAITRCLRTYRGISDLTQAGICFTKDIVYLRGYLLIEQTVREDETILDRLAVGKVSLALLPDVLELGVMPPQQASALRKHAYDAHLDEYILSFEGTGAAQLSQRGE